MIVKLLTYKTGLSFPVVMRYFKSESIVSFSERILSNPIKELTLEISMLLGGEIVIISPGDVIAIPGYGNKYSEKVINNIEDLLFLLKE